MKCVLRCGLLWKHSNLYMKTCSKVMRGEIPRLYLLVAALALCSVPADGLCERGRTWWHRQLGACLPCTRCDPRSLAVQYPCEVHRDTVCQSLYEIRIWPFHRARKDNDTKDSESSDYEYYEYADYAGKVTESSDGVEWDFQTSTLTLAASGCAVFFIVVVSLSLYHSRQWKVLKQALKSDFDDLSAKLKLMEAGGEPPTAPPAPDRHVYCNVHIGKDALLGPEASKGLGNVYTQDRRP